MYVSHAALGPAHRQTLCYPVEGATLIEYEYECEHVSVG